ncbi:MAG: T9SS type A sorting domain-containing protein, partial [Saprospiraceae bacterium]|nr:T9SS type A sorting domain-containing protein [Saprospiraceae bacterium]
AQWPTIVRLADFDYDGVKEAMTVVGISNTGTTDVRYFENLGTDTAPVFQFVASHPFGIPVYAAPWQFVDIDGDCDLDMFLFNFTMNSAPLRFLENKGTPKVPWFGDSQPQLNPFGFSTPVNASGSQLSSAFYQFVDIDDDNDFDLVYGGRFNNTVGDENYYFYINADTSGNGTAPSYSAPLVNPFNLPQPAVDAWIFPSFLDLDCDGDWDFFATNAGKGIDYFENIGTASAPDFGFAPAASWYLPAPELPGFLTYHWGDWIDIGGDGDLDLLYGGSHLIQFYENIANGTMACQANKPMYDQCTPPMLIHRIEKSPFAEIKVTPNPSGGIVQLSFSEQPPNDYLLIVSDACGRIFIKEKHENTQNLSQMLDLSSLSPGAYLLNLCNKSGNFCSKIIKI